jgi:hypothetical protein
MPDREAFWALYRGITLRQLPGPPRIPLPSPGTWGEPVRVGIASDPTEADRYLPEPIPRHSEACPVSGVVTVRGDRLPASLQPEFGNGVSFQVGVWVHAACLERCQDTGQQRGVPW